MASVRYVNLSHTIDLRCPGCKRRSRTRTVTLIIIDGQPDCIEIDNSCLFCAWEIP